MFDTLKINNLSCDIYDDLSFTINSGKCFWVKGKNGVGKTTLLRSIAGLNYINSGNIQLNGEVVNHYDLLSICHFVSDGKIFNNNLTVLEDYKYWKNISGCGDIDKAISDFDLEYIADKEINHLSLGQQKIVELARLSLLQRPVWILDEPLNGLDNKSIMCLGNAVQEHLDNNNFVICASHRSIPFDCDEYEINNVY